MTWSVPHIADALETGLRRVFEQLDIEQAVYGLDVADEIGLHPYIAAALQDSGYGAYRECHYPFAKPNTNQGGADHLSGPRLDDSACADRMSAPPLVAPQSGRFRLSAIERCDFVLTPDGRDLRRPEVAGTLFDSADAVNLDEAFWLEVKVVSQFNAEGPNANYSSQLLSCVRQDVTKLSKEPGILHAGLLIVMFVADERIADHDLRIWQDRCLERSLPIGAPSIRRLPITDRHGHGLCVLALYPVSHL